MMHNYAKKYIKYKHKYTQLLSKLSGGMNPTSPFYDKTLQPVLLSPQIQTLISELKKSVDYTEDRQKQSIRTPYNKEGHTKLVVFTFLNNIELYMRAEQTLSELLDSSLSNKPIAISTDQASEINNNPDLKKYIDFLSLLITHTRKYDLRRYNEHIYKIVNILTGKVCSDYDFVVEFVIYKRLRKLYLSQQLIVRIDPLDEDTFSENYFSKFSFDLKSGTIIKISHTRDSIVIIDSSNEKKKFIGEQRKQILIIMMPTRLGGRLGNVLFRLNNFILYLVANKSMLFKDDTYAYCLLQPPYTHTIPGIAYLDMDMWNHCTYMENISEYLKFECLYSPIPFLHYLTLDDQAPIEKLKKYYTSITSSTPIIKSGYINDGKTNIILSFRASDFCTGANTCFNNHSHNSFSESEGIQAGFPILSIEYYINCLDALLKDTVEKKALLENTDFSKYRIVLFCHATFIDKKNIKLYKEIFLALYPGIEVLLEEEYLELDPYSTHPEVDIIDAAAFGGILVCSNSTFSYHMFARRMMNYKSTNIIFYPEGFIYANFFFLDLSFTNSFMSECKDFELLGTTQQNFVNKLCPIQHSFIKGKSPYYVCYLPATNVYSASRFELFKAYKDTHKSDGYVDMHHAVDTTRILIFMISISKTGNSITLNTSSCNLSLFDYLAPYCTYKEDKSTNSVTFTLDTTRITNRTFKELIETSDVTPDFITKLRAFLKNLSFERDTEFKYYDGMQFASQGDIKYFFEIGDFNNMRLNKYKALTHI